MYNFHSLNQAVSCNQIRNVMKLINVRLELTLFFTDFFLKTVALKISQMFTIDSKEVNGERSGLLNPALLVTSLVFYDSVIQKFTRRSDGRCVSQVSIYWKLTFDYLSC